MADEHASPSGPDFSQGVSPEEFSGDMLLGHVGDEAVLLVRSGDEIFAINAWCSHYHGPLAEGLVVDGGDPLPLASRLFRPEDRRGHARAGADSARRAGRSSRKGAASSSGGNASNRSRAARLSWTRPKRS